MGETVKVSLGAAMEEDDFDDLLDDVLDDFEREEIKEKAEEPEIRTEEAVKPGDAAADPADEQAVLAGLAEIMQDEAFAEDLKKTMGSLDAPDTEELEQFRQALMDSFTNMAEAAEGEEGGLGEQEGDMVESFLKDVLSKDVLYEPMAEMRDKYPEWLAKSQDIEASEYARYSKQHALVTEICAAYDRNADFETIA